MWDQKPVGFVLQETLVNYQQPALNFNAQRTILMKETIATEKAPAAVGPYSQAIRVGKLLYTSGQIALDPEKMEMVGEDVTEQAHRVLQNLTSVLEAGGSSLQNVIKTTVFLRRISDYGDMNAVYNEYFSAGKPARSAIAVGALPLGALVEIEAVALVAAPEKTKKKKDIKKKKGKKKKKKKK